MHLKLQDFGVGLPDDVHEPLGEHVAVLLWVLVQQQGPIRVCVGEGAGDDGRLRWGGERPGGGDTTPGVSQPPEEEQ